MKQNFNWENSVCETENFKTSNRCGKQLIKMLILEISIKEILKLFTHDNSSQVLF